MGDFEDMNATPIDKLGIQHGGMDRQVPMMQSKQDVPAVQGTLNYEALMKQTHAMQQPMQQQPMQQQPMQQQPMQQQPMQQQPMQQLMQPQLANSHLLFAGDEDEDDGDLLAYPTRPRRRRVQFESRRVRSPSLWDRVKAYKSSLLVVVIVFVMLAFVSPKLASMVPQLLNTSGKFNWLGLVTLAVLCGGVHRLSDHYINGS